MKNKPLFIFILATILLVACTSVPMSSPTGTPIPSSTPSLQKVAERKKTEEELVSFMLDFIVRLQEEHTNYSQVSGQPWLNPPPNANLIVFLPPNEEIDKKPWEQLKFDEPIKVWWFFDNKLVEATDNQEAIQKYEEYYMADARWPWRYQWGILSISDDNKKATMYVESSSCPECAGGMLYTLRRDDSGEWQIIDSELLWLS